MRVCSFAETTLQGGQVYARAGLAGVGSEQGLQKAAGVPKLAGGSFDNGEVGEGGCFGRAKAQGAFILGAGSVRLMGDLVEEAEVEMELLVGVFGPFGLGEELESAAGGGGVSALCDLCVGESQIAWCGV